MLKFDQFELLAVVDVARDLRVDFLKLAPSRDFETSSRAVKKLATLKFRAKNAVVDPDLLGNLTSVMTKTSAAY